ARGRWFRPTVRDRDEVGSVRRISGRWQSTRIEGAPGRRISSRGLRVNLTAKTMNPAFKTALLLTCLGLGSGLGGCLAKPDPEQAAVDIDLRRYVVDLQDQQGDYALGGEQPLVTIVVWSD